MAAPTNMSIGDLARIFRETYAPHRKLPGPNARESPSFDGSNPHELPRFLKQMEAMFSEYQIRGDQLKKEALPRYADASTESQWEALKEYEAPATYLDFKKAIYDSYGELEYVEEGSIEALDKACRFRKNIAIDDLASLKALKQEFTVHTVKLCSK